MAGVEYDLDTSGGLMPQIHALLAPASDDNKKQRREKDRISMSYRRPGRAVNHDCCDSCKEGGDLICCDNCPAAFHLQCHDPPLDEDDLPTGEWLCHYCHVLAKDQKGEDETNSYSSRNSNVNNVKQDIQKESGAVHAKTTDSCVADGEIEDMNILNEDVNPDGEEIEDESPLQTLIRVASIMNPKQFQLPNELQCTTALPGNHSFRSHGCNKRIQRKEGNKAGAKKLAHELDNGIVPLPAKVCFECRKSCLKAPLIQCDFCPLLFHQDCLDPPLTTLPTGRWMCPNHVENMLDQKILSSSSLTERVKLWNRFNGNVSQDAVKITFLKKVHRQHPPFRYKIKLPPRNRVQVPNAVKEHYRDPPKLLSKVNERVPTNFDSGSSVTNEIDKSRNYIASPEEQEMWLSNVLSMQTSITAFLMQKQFLKQSEKMCSNGDGVDDENNDASRCELSLASEESLVNAVQIPTTQSSSQNPQTLKRSVTQRIINGDVHSPNNGESSTETISRTKSNSFGDSSLVTVLDKSSGTSNVVVVKPSVLPKSVAPQKAGRSVKTTTNKVILSNCDIDSNLSFSSFEGSSTPKYTLASKSTGSIATNSTYVLQMKSPKRLQSSSSNNCSEYLALSKLPATNTVPVKSEESAEDQLLNDSTKITHIKNLLQDSIKDETKVKLNHLDQKMVQMLAYQRIQQLESFDQSNDVAKNVSDVAPPHRTFPVIRSRAALTALNGAGSPGLMMYRVFSIGLGEDMDLSLSNYGHCNYVSARHACIFYDEMTKQFELLNYSEYGSTVDNVIYSCDFSDKNSVVTPPTSVVAAIRTIIDKYRGKSRTITEKQTMTSRPNQTYKSCKCKSSNFNLSGGSGAGWEGTAVLHHGSLLRFGCLHFVFSITENATREALFMANKPNDKLNIKTDVPQMLAMCSSSSKPVNNRES